MVFEECFEAAASLEAWSTARGSSGLAHGLWCSTRAAGMLPVLPCPVTVYP